MTTGSDILRAALTAGSPNPVSVTVIRPDTAIEGDQYPFLVYFKVDTQREWGLDNTLHCTTETFKIECWGKTRELTEVLEAQVIAALRAANLPPYEDDPDGQDTEVRVRAAILLVDIYISSDDNVDEITYEGGGSPP